MPNSRGSSWSSTTSAYKALWEDRKDIGQVETLVEIGKGVGLDGDDMARSLEQGDHSQTVMAQYEEALQYGINGIPTFLVGNLLFTGAHPYPIFKQAIERYKSS